MQKEIFRLESEHLNTETEVGVYGHYGISLLIFPAEADSCLESESHGLIDAIGHIIKIGKVKVFTATGIHGQSWGNSEKSPQSRSARHFEYNKYIEDELVPFIYDRCGGPIPIITCGASTGAFYAANAFFRRPDIFLGTISMSGDYNLESYSGGFFDDNCYFNSPMHYLPNLNDNYWLTYLKSRHHIYIISGSGKNEKPDNSLGLGKILSKKGITHLVDIWGNDYSHDYESWKEMLKYFASKKL